MADYCKAIQIQNILAEKFRENINVTFVYDDKFNLWEFTFQPSSKGWGKLMPVYVANISINVDCSDLIFTIKDKDVLATDIYVKFLEVVDKYNSYGVNIINTVQV